MNTIEINNLLVSPQMKKALIVQGILSATLVKQPMWLRVATVGLTVASTKVKDNDVDTAAGVSALNLWLGVSRMVNAYKSKQIKKELAVGAINTCITIGALTHAHLFNTGNNK